MDLSNIPEMARQTFYNYLNVDDPFGIDVLKKAIDSVQGKSENEQGWTLPFRLELARVIQSEMMSVDQFEAITGRDFQDQAALSGYLREVWRTLYGDMPIVAE